jgi:hypothetical protein
MSERCAKVDREKAVNSDTLHGVCFFSPISSLLAAKICKIVGFQKLLRPCSRNPVTNVNFAQAPTFKPTS